MKRYTTTIYIDSLPIRNTELDEFGEIHIIAEYYISNDGIGSYECRGIKGNDGGNDYAVVESVIYDFDNWLSDYDRTDEVEAAIKEYMNDDRVKYYTAKIEAEIDVTKKDYDF